MLNSIKRLRTHSIHILVPLLGALFLGSIVLGVLVQQNPLINSFDGWLYRLLTQNNYFLIDILVKPFNFNWVNWAGPMPTYLYVLVLIGLIVVVIKNKRMVPYYILSIVIGSVLAYIITDLDWKFVFRERPFLTLPSPVDEIGKSAWSNLSSYPSGHARETALYSTIVGFFVPKLKWALIIFVIFIAFSRVYIGAHFPTDALAGVIIGFLSAKVALIISREIQIDIESRRRSLDEKISK